MRTIRQKHDSLSPTQEDYVRAMYLLSESGERVGVTNLASRLNLSKSTVSERIKELQEAGLVTAAPYSEIALTKAGQKTGQRLTYKHRLIEVFLHETLHIPKERVHEEAHQLEHACSDLVIERLATFLEHPKRDPHGTNIPKP